MPESGKSEQTGENPVETAGMATNNQLVVVSGLLEPSTSVYTSSDKEPPAKKSRHHENSGGAEEQSLRNTLTEDQPYLLLLPFDILLEILSKTSHPGDLLAVARTCKDLCRKLTDPCAYALWRRMRRSISLPDPTKYTAEVKGAYHSDGTSVKVIGVRNFIHEPAYAAFVFDGGVCEICDKLTDRPYRSFSLRIRLCGNSECLEKIRTHGLLTWTFMNSEPQSVTSIIPVLEVDRIFQPSTSYAPDEFWPCNSKNGRGTRASLVDASRASALSPDEVGSASARNDVWMEVFFQLLPFCVDLFRWNQAWQRKSREIHQANLCKGKNFARDEGWDYSTLANETTYGSILTLRCKLRENITDEELQRLRPTLAHELYLLQRKKEAKSQTRLREANINDLWKLYQKLMSQPATYPHLPPFSVFLELPATKILQSLDLVKAGYDVKRAATDKGCIIGMLKQQIEEWVDQAKREMLKNLNASAEWNSMISARRMTHPVLRLDSRWKCKVCNKVEPKYDSDGCLDFVGVCRHQCIEGDRKKKKKGAATRTWNASNFVQDEQAIAVMRQCLERLDVGVEGEAVTETRKRFNATLWRCMSCNPPLFLRAKSVVGHSHRHTSLMQVEIVPQVAFSIMNPRPNLFGLARWLVQNSKDAKKEVVETNFGCQHCTNEAKTQGAETPADKIKSGQAGASGTRSSRHEQPAGADTSQGASSSQEKRKEFVNKFNFNGLRSHLSSKHKIFQVRDEDFWCHKRIYSFPAEDRSAHFLDALFSEF